MIWGQGALVLARKRADGFLIVSLKFFSIIFVVIDAKYS